MKTRNIIITGVIVVIIIIAVTFFLVRYKKRSVNVQSILFIGDSNTAADFSYADQLKKRFPGLVIKKVAQNGAKTDWMIGQLNEELKKNKYDVVAILGGSNDIYALANTTGTKANLDAMYKLAQARGAKVLAVTPPNKDYYVNKTDQKQALLSNLVAWMYGNRNIDFLIDFHKITADKSFFNSSDGYLHANANAHSVLASQTAKKLNLK